MTTQAEKDTQGTPTEAQVAEYLATHPDFFSRHSNLLTQLHLPHETGGVVSLLERQLQLLRQGNTRLHDQLTELIDTARYNDSQFDKTRRMVLRMLNALTLDDLAIALSESLCKDFDSDTVSLMLFSKEPFDTNGVRVVDPRQYGPVLPLVKDSDPICGELTENQYNFIFSEADADKVQSAAVVPLIRGETIGLLAIGKFEAGYFHSGQGTVFLQYVADVLSRIVARVVHETRLEGIDASR